MALLPVLVLGFAGQAQTGAVDYDRDVLPILADHCFHCHGPDEATRKAGLRLDSHEDLLFVADPATPDDSELVRRLHHTDAERRMPPATFEAQPTPDEVALLERWVREGLAFEGHWAFTAPTSPSKPDTAADPWCADPLDAFVLARLRAEGLVPAPPAPREAWLRRVTFDLTGLPPTPEELDALLADDAPGAEARVIDRLLASPRRAEHRTREWLDLARYADTNGFQNDFGRDQWPWRDWVLRAFASNLPYDTFVLQQTAGDLLEGAPLDAVIATGFHRNHRTVTEAGSIDEEWRVEKVADRAETTATAFLGLTLGCARCHDHKYDPLTRRDYYSFYAFFDRIDEKGYYEETRGNVPPVLNVPTPEQEARLAALATEATTRERELDELQRTAPERLVAWFATAPPLDGALGVPLLEFAGRTITAESTDRGPRIELTGAVEDSVDLGRGVVFEQDRAFSVSLWLRPEGSGAVYSRMEDTDRYRGTDLVLLGDLRPAVHLIHAWNANAIKVVGVEPLEVGRWQHVAVTYDGSRKASGVRLFIDGAERALTVEVDALDGTLAVDEPLRLGHRRYAGVLRGAMHDFRVDAVVLDATAVRSLAARRVRGHAAGLVAATETSGTDELTRLAAPALPFFAPLDDTTRGARAALAEARRRRVELERNEIATVMVLRERAEPRETRILDRGLYDRPVGEPLAPDVPAALGPLPEGAPRDRLGLARWLIARENPLTARVAVNRVWASFFGEGLVATPEDFGVRGARPTQAALLDHLAVSFMDSGWDLRALERRIALSATYRQSSRADGALVERDPANHLLARGPRHRLDAEAVRDQALFVSGLLVEQLGGRSVKPYQPAGLWEELAGGAGEGPYVQGIGADLYRRSLYTYRKRTVAHPTLMTFDAPTFEYCVARRARTNTPLQALAQWNDPTYVEAARHLAARLLNAATDDVRRLELGVRTVLTRAPRPAETEALLKALAAHRAQFEADPASADAYLAVGDSAPNAEAVAALGRTDWAAYSLLAATLLTLDEAVTKR